MRIGNTEFADTFAEAFAMVGARMLITAETAEWALAAGRSVTGFATSIIGCKCEAGIEATIAPDDTPDGRPGVSVLIFARKRVSWGCWFPSGHPTLLKT